MKRITPVLFVNACLCLIILGSCESKSQSAPRELKPAVDTVAPVTRLYIDVHDLEPGKVKFSDVMAAHQKDLAAEGKYHVAFQKFWVDEAAGKVYCLSTAPDSAAITATHAEAHGLLPSHVYPVSDGKEAEAITGKKYFLDVHQLAPNSVTAADVAGAHEKDLAVQGKYGVHFLNYWVDTKAGKVFCLSEAIDSNAVKSTHKEAHGLMPVKVEEVKEGR